MSRLLGSMFNIKWMNDGVCSLRFYMSPLIQMAIPDGHRRKPLHCPSCFKADWYSRSCHDVCLNFCVVRYLTEHTVISGLWYVPSYFFSPTCSWPSPSTKAIAVHTFIILVLRQKIKKKTSKYVVLSIWIFIALVIGIPNAAHRNKQYYGVNGFCTNFSIFSKRKFIPL